MHPAMHVREHHARCILHFSRLQVAASLEADVPPSLADEVGEATAAIVAETEAAADAVASTAGLRRGATTGFLAARLARMAAAANDAVDAAKNSDATLLRRHLAHFEALTSAMWTVQLGILTPADQPWPAPQRHVLGRQAAGGELVTSSTVPWFCGHPDQRG
jgi:hypothetical protein